jgi:hypothetical protein
MNLHHGTLGRFLANVGRRRRPRDFSPEEMARWADYRMSLQSWQETLATQQGAGSNFASFTTAKTVLNPQSLYTLPAGFFSIGKMLNIKVSGLLANIVTTPGTVTFQVMLGSIVVFTTGAIQMSTTSHTGNPFWLDILLTCRAVGSGTSANLMGVAHVAGKQFVLASGADGTQSETVLVEPDITPAVGTGFDSTIANILDFWAGFSISQPTNNITVQQYLAASLN